MIEYKNLPNGHEWIATIGDTIICVLSATTDFNSGITQISVNDFTQKGSQYIPGSPFESLNKAKAVIEYHYRNLL